MVSTDWIQIENIWLCYSLPFSRRFGMMEQRFFFKKHSSKPISWRFHARFWTTSSFFLSFGGIFEQRRYFPSSSLDSPWPLHIFAATRGVLPTKSLFGHGSHDGLHIGKGAINTWRWPGEFFHAKPTMVRTWWGCGQPSHVNPGLGISEYNGLKQNQQRDYPTIQQKSGIVPNEKCTKK